MKKMKKLIFLLFLLTSSLWAANEIQFPYVSVANPILYAVVSKAADANVWNRNTSTWQVWNDANEPNYAITLSLSHKDYYTASFPTGITAAGVYPVNIYKQQGTSPNVTNDLLVGSGEIAWNGSAEITSITTKTAADANFAIIKKGIAVR
jgi:hypothetical protein